MTEPFLTYLTVFKSRLALANILLGLTGYTHQPVETLQRRIKQVVDKRNDLLLDDPKNERFFNYLVEKTLVSSMIRKSGRYKGFSLAKSGEGWVGQTARGLMLETFPVYQVDQWMSDPHLSSTVGAPTPENVGEIVEFGYQLRLISRAKNTWTASGNLAHALRTHTPLRDADLENPFRLGLEIPVLMRQAVDSDGLMLREILREIVHLTPTFTREALSARFGDIVDRAVASARETRLNPIDLRTIRDFAAQVHRTMDKRAKMSKGPGLLEHRVSPRLEWLTDLGYLSKAGLARNSFEYRVEPSAHGLMESLDRLSDRGRWGAEVALREWCQNPAWSELRASFAVGSGSSAFVYAYQMLRRKIGPVPLQDMAFISAMHTIGSCDFSKTFDEVIDFARATEGVSLSGGRYRRSPENIFISDAALDL